MRRAIVLTVCCLMAGQAGAQSTPRKDALLGDYFAIWDSNAAVTPDTVARLYAPRITYYGHPMTRADLYRDKLSFIRQWPQRRYRVEPGTSNRRCDAGGTVCVYSAVLAWHRAGASGTHSGRSRVSLTVAESDGGIKIVKEGAVTLDP